MRGALDEIERSGVHVDALGLDCGELLRHLIEDGAEEGHGGEDVRFVHQGDQVAAALGVFKGGAEETLGAAARDEHRVTNFGGIGCVGVFARGEEAFGVFAVDDEVGGEGALGFQGRVIGMEEADGADAGVEIEDLANFDLRDELGAVRVADVGESHGAQEDSVGVTARLHGAAGRGSPLRRNSSAPAGDSRRSKLMPESLGSSACRTRTASWTTSGPMPSPGRRVILNDFTLKGNYSSGGAGDRSMLSRL
jgi:hypothetical protein